MVGPGIPPVRALLLISKFSVLPLYTDSVAYDFIGLANCGVGLRND